MAQITIQVNTYSDDEIQDVVLMLLDILHSGRTEGKGSGALSRIQRRLDRIKLERSKRKEKK